MATSQTSAKSARLPIIVAIIALAVVGIAVWAGAARSGADSGPPNAALPDATQMGVITLNVNDLELQRSYYEHGVGLKVLSESDDAVELGLNTPLIRLQASSEGESTVTPTEAGLYHSAILYPDETSLARVILNLATVAPATFQGSSDHAVSLAFYFVDPEGNGRELYVDRPRAEWVWQDGEVTMGSAALDPNAFIQEHLGNDNALPDEAVMGHVHMKVGDLEAAEQFYADVLGFAVTVPSAEDLTSITSRLDAAGSPTIGLTAA